MLKRARAYRADDGDGHFDEMDEYSPNGKFYYADDVDKEIGKLQKKNEKLRRALEHIRDDQIIQGMSPSIFAKQILENV